MIRRRPCSRGGWEAVAGHARTGGKRLPPSGRPVAPAVEEVVGTNEVNFVVGDDTFAFGSGAGGAAVALPQASDGAVDWSRPDAPAVEEVVGPNEVNFVVGDDTFAFGSGAWGAAVALAQASDGPPSLLSPMGSSFLIVNTCPGSILHPQGHVPDPLAFSTEPSAASPPRQFHPAVVVIQSTFPVYGDLERPSSHTTTSI
ncbi:uncharacterized protein LOC123442287 [Hordeum vulgare subsp. vulgare]|uniref:uncharacterized protein LOC123442287 n=1 Tax=Hordeum vulgare subsp. vulgare TaxID=112509 RepID=UPI001D1A4EB3|nr:uncharacterized protein LOC123442287 [Hordeum vulgare subsp. vulgare]